MPAKKFDGLIEAVRYAPDGKIKIVRAYERRGATFSDLVLIERALLVERLKKGEKFVTGKRKEYLASTFETSRSISLVGGKGQEVISTSPNADRDLLEEVPVF
jgi:hypothetical protein